VKAEREMTAVQVKPVSIILRGSSDVVNESLVNRPLFSSIHTGYPSLVSNLSHRSGMLNASMQSLIVFNMLVHEYR